MLLSEREKETFMEIANVLREKAVKRYVIHDEEYKRLVDIAEAAETCFLDQEASDDKKEQMNQIWRRRSDAEECGQTLLYLAGLMNGISFLRDMGLLDMIFEEESIYHDRKDCYLVAVIPGEEGCIALHMDYGRRLFAFVEKWRGKGVKLFVINQPEDYVEYEPYRFVSMLDEFLDKIKPFMVQDMPEGKEKKEELPEVGPAGGTE
ncbi:DUF6718 family protein [Candidatus Ventrimonas sp. KK005]